MWVAIIFVAFVLVELLVELAVVKMNGPQVRALRSDDAAVAPVVD